MLRSGALKYDRDAVSRDTGLRMNGPGRTQQQFKDQCDIRLIVKNYTRTGMVPQRTAMPLPAEFHDTFDFMSCQNILVQAKRAFQEIPAEIRKRFGHDPAEFYKFCTDEKNVDEMVKLGIADVIPKVVEKVQKVEVVNQPSKEESSPTKP